MILLKRKSWNTSSNPVAGGFMPGIPGAVDYGSNQTMPTQFMGPATATGTPLVVDQAARAEKDLEKIQKQRRKLKNHLK